MKQHFEELTDLVWPTMRRMLGQIKQTITFPDYCKLVQSIVTTDVHRCRQVFMTTVADVNKDAQVCSGDLFQLLQLCNRSSAAGKILMNDVKTIIGVLEA